MTILTFLTLIGSVGLFLYGMQLMSEGLQKIAGDSLRGMLAAMTKNRVTGMLIGILVTALVQSSSATTVMVVSFVNAGLVTLTESLAVIMGANVGSAATTWLISLFGFTFDISYLCFPLIAVSLPFFNSRKSTNNSWGELILGFALLFLGIEELKQCTPSLAFLPSWTDVFSVSSTWGYGSAAIYLAIGTLLTLLLQTSSATFTISLLFCVNGWIPFEMGCAMVLGSNIGTCLTPLLASLSANTMAQRAAYGHLIFNLIGAVWMLILFPFFCEGMLCLSDLIGLGTVSSVSGMALNLALFHTSFNLINLCLLLPFAHVLTNVISHFIPEKEDQDESFKLQFLNKGFIGSSGELALVQAQKEVSRYGKETYRMFSIVQSMLDDRLPTERQEELMIRVRKMEEDSDKAELEIAQYLNQISSKTLSLSGEQLCRNIYKMVDELESVADAIYHCSTTLYQKSEKRIRFTAEMNLNVEKMFGLLDDSLKHMLKVLDADSVPLNALDRAYNIEDEINNFRNQLRNESLDSVENRKIDYEQNTCFMIVINECEKIGDYIINVIAAASE